MNKSVKINFLIIMITCSVIAADAMEEKGSFEADPASDDSELFVEDSNETKENYKIMGRFATYLGIIQSNDNTEEKFEQLIKAAKGRKIPSATIPECYLLDEAIVHNDPTTVNELIAQFGDAIIAKKGHFGDSLPQAVLHANPAIQLKIKTHGGCLQESKRRSY
jgi:effector-binding domain-containing protein